MFVNYVALMLINLVAGLALLGVFVALNPDIASRKKWASAFSMTGFVALATGLHMVWNWPLPGSYNSAFGETSVLFGILFLGAALSLAAGWELLPVAIYGFFAGLAAIVVGLRLMNLGMTRAPVLSGIGYILAGLAGVLAVPTYYLQKSLVVRIISALFLVIAAAIFAVTGYAALWRHLADYANWVPLTMR